MSAAPQRQTRKQQSEEESNKFTNADTPGRHATPGRHGSAVPRLAPVERSAVAVELLPELQLLLRIDEVRGRRVDALLPLPQARRRVARSKAAGARRRGLGAVPRARGHHVDITPPHERPRLGLGV
jgi:hypothetical protein